MMMRLLKSLVAIALAFLWLGLTSPAGAADFPKGKFTVKDPGGTVWEMNFDGKDKVTVARAGKEVVEGTYKVNKDEIEFTDEKGPYAGVGDAKTGTYKWKLEGAQLTFNKVKDESEGRSRILTAGAWERKETE
jgi:hypothetical protein